MRQRTRDRVQTPTQTHLPSQHSRLGITVTVCARGAPELQAAAAAGLHRESDVVHHRQPVKDAGNLVRAHQTDACALVHGHRGDVVPTKTNDAFIGPQGAGYLVNQGRLAGSVGPISAWMVP
jgi:hypothetical protein